MENVFEDDFEELRDKIMRLFEKGLINQTEKYFMNQKQATEKVMRIIMEDYREQKINDAKLNTATGLMVFGFKCVGKV